MDQTVNPLGQPIGFPLSTWSPPPVPKSDPMAGTYCRLDPLNPRRHAEDLYAAHARDDSGQNWTYLPYGPFQRFEDYRSWLRDICAGDDPQFYAITPDETGKPAGIASYLRIAPESGSIEAGHIHFSNALKRSRASTEAMFLMMTRAFELGYRRYEWKCDALNAASRAAAERLGFTFEGVFRQAAVYKGRNRDTAWYSIIDSEWERLRPAFLRWLDPANFDRNGRQHLRLSDLTSIRSRWSG